MQEEDSENVRMTEIFNRAQKVLTLMPDFGAESEFLVDKPYNVVYDPLSLKSEFKISTKPIYSPALIKELNISILRYNHYLEDPDGIRPNEISKYNKDWMSNALNLVFPNRLLKDYTV